jgi:hypothetical protein
VTIDDVKMACFHRFQANFYKIISQITFALQVAGQTGLLHIGWKLLLKFRVFTTRLN